MKTTVLILMSFCTFLGGTVIEKELNQLDILIEATEWSVTEQKNLRAQMIEYQTLQEKYLKSNEDDELLFQLIKSAYYVLETIKKLHLELTFEPEFISELSLLAKPALKHQL